MDLVDVKPLIKETVKTLDLMRFIKIDWGFTNKHLDINKLYHGLI